MTGAEVRQRMKQGREQRAHLATMKRGVHARFLHGVKSVLTCTLIGVMGAQALAATDAAGPGRDKVDRADALSWAAEDVLLRVPGPVGGFCDQKRSA